MVELIWDGKYDADGKRVAPPRVALPFQTVETVNESAQQRQRMFDLFNQGRDPDWRNRLIWGDKKYVLPSLLPEFAGKVDLIYIDPPFATGADFSFTTEVGDERFTKEASMIEQKAYRDTWGRGLDGYIAWMSETTIGLFELLTSTGTLAVHLDHRAVFHTKILLDEVFGSGGFVNCVSWRRQVARGMKAHAKFMPFSSDYILIYSKSASEATWNIQKRVEFISAQEASQKYHEDEKGFFRTSDPGTYANDSLVRLFYEGRIHVTRGGSAKVENGKLVVSGGKIGIKYYRERVGDKVIEETVIDNVWDDIPGLAVTPKESVGYPTQKPEALLERIIKASSNEGDLVLDCFAGSGTTAAVAEKLGRRWITCDLGRFAVHTTRKRLLAIEGVRPFIVQNLGKYERQVWQQAQFGADAARQVAAYRHFILDLYHADPIAGYTWLHGKKAGRLVHVGTVDSPVALGDVQQAAIEFRQAIGTGADAPRSMGLDLLGWDFALDMNETAAQLAAEAGLDLRFVRIPREVLEAKAVEQGDIRFFELAALGVDVHTGKGRNLRLQLTDFMVPPDDVPQEVMAAVDHWSAWIDYWAVDFDHKNDTFHNMWQSYRTRRDRSLQLSIEHTYDAPGTYTVVVKVIDILGNDTTRTITVAVQ
jgi:adenine-specific DNA-methyltransferase